VANETGYAQSVTYAAWIDARIIQVLRTANVMLNLMYPVQVSEGSNAKKLVTKAVPTAAVVAEAAEATVQQLTRSAGPTLTAQKIVVLNELTEEGMLFGGPTGWNFEEVGTDQGLAISEKVDTDACALFTSLSNTAGTSGQPLDPRIFGKALYLAGLSNYLGSLVGIIHNTQAFHIKDYILTAGASVWANPNVVPLMGEQPTGQNGFLGSLLGTPIYQTQHTPSANAGADWAGAVIAPNDTIAELTVRPPDTMLENWDVSKRSRQMSTDFYYDVKVRRASTGCKIVTSQTA